MEVIALFFRIGENTTIMATAVTEQVPPPSAPGPGYGYPEAPDYPGGPSSPADQVTAPPL